MSREILNHLSHGCPKDAFFQKAIGFASHPVLLGSEIFSKKKNQESKTSRLLEKGPLGQP